MTLVCVLQLRLMTIVFNARLIIHLTIFMQIQICMTFVKLTMNTYARDNMSHEHRVLNLQ